MKKIKIALIQQSARDDIKLNIEKAQLSVKKAAAKGANIICFAELAFTPFYPQIPASNNKANFAERIPGFITDSFVHLAKQLNVVIILNQYEFDGKNYYDSSPVINTNGKIMGISRMIHITEYACFHEQGYYTPGNTDPVVYDTEFGKIGIAICYDRHYPEYMRKLALEGAEIVFIPQAGAVGEWPDGLYEAELRVAAFQNGYFTALCNRVGKEKCLTFAGESFVCDPSGNVIARAAKEKNEILLCDIDLNLVQSSHAKKLFLRDRRPKLYSKWFNKKGRFK